MDIFPDATFNLPDGDGMISNIADLVNKLNSMPYFCGNNMCNSRCQFL